jgi:hypothetical protein
LLSRYFAGKLDHGLCHHHRLVLRAAIWEHPVDAAAVGHCKGFKLTGLRLVGDGFNPQAIISVNSPPKTRRKRSAKELAETTFTVAGWEWPAIGQYLEMSAPIHDDLILHLQVGSSRALVHPPPSSLWLL